MCQLYLYTRHEICTLSKMLFNMASWGEGLQISWREAGDIIGFSNAEARLVQFSSVAQSCPTLCNPMNRSMPGLPVHHQLPEFTQTRVH